MNNTTSAHASGSPFHTLPSGYIRQKNSVQRSRATTEEFALKSDIGRDRVVTTVVGGADSDDLESGMGKGRWNNSDSKLTEMSSDEEPEQRSWRGIRKTTVSTQVAERG